MQKMFDKVKGEIKSRMDEGQKPASSGGHHQHGGPPHFDPNAPKPVYPQQGQQPPGPGTRPPKVKAAHYKGAMRFYHPRGHQHDVARDLGYTGILDGRIVWTWGDTLMGKPPGRMICAVDSTSVGNMSAPMTAVDTALAPGSDNVANWIDCNAEEEAGGGLSCYAFGGTNIVEIAPNHGLVYYLKNHRPGGVGKIMGAGVATCRMDGDVPRSRRLGELWNDFEPKYGDVGVVHNSKDGMVYAFGHGPDWDKELPVRTYLARVPAQRAGDVGAYEYWDGGSGCWTRTRLAKGDFGTIRVDKQHAVFDWMVMNQSAPFWSNYFNCWMVLHGTCFGFSDVMCRTADRLEGPWEDHGMVANTLPEGKGEGFRYCHTGHPEFDPSGKTVLVTWTRENAIYGTVIEWE